MLDKPARAAIFTALNVSVLIPEGYMAQVTLPDGHVLATAEGATIQDVAEQIGPGLARAAVAAKVDGRLVDLSFPVQGNPHVAILTPDDEEGLEVMRHSCAHVMAEALCSIWPQTRLVYGPTVRDGFYYDIDLDDPIRPTDFAKIEAKMAEVVAQDRPYTRRCMSREEAIERLQGDKYKTDNVNRATGHEISFYSQGDEFEDLCRGPHVPSTGKVGFLKIMSVAGDLDVDRVSPHEWAAADPGLLGLDICIIGRQVKTAHGGRIDLLGIDQEGDLNTVRRGDCAPGRARLGRGDRTSSRHTLIAL